MGRPSALLHKLTFLLIAILGWPWNVALAIVESSQIAAQFELRALQAPENPKVQGIVRAGWWDRQCCSTIAPDCDCDEEEGDDVCSFELSLAPSSVQILAAPDRPPSSGLPRIPPAGSTLPKHLDHLRC